MLTTVSREVTGSEGERRKKVGHYVLGPCLGEGSFAKVRLGTHIISREKVAVKIVSKRVIIQRETARRNFRREALLLQHVSHPNIVRLYEAIETPNSYYLVFELAESGNLLQQVTERGSLPEGEARHFMRQIVSAVDHLHRSGIVHRDLKLENFLISAAQDVKLVDFGLSALCQREGTLNTQCGSPVYAAPEIFGSRRYGPPVDLWSLGVCLYAMVVGRLPFLPDPPTNLPQLHALVLKGANIPTFLSTGLQQVLSGLLELQESKRLSVSDLLNQSWLTCSGSQPITRFPPVSKAPPPSVDTSIVRYMTTMFRFSESDVIHSVTERKLNASSATYHLLRRNTDRRRVRDSEDTLLGGDMLNGEGVGVGTSDSQASVLSLSRSTLASLTSRAESEYSTKHASKDCQEMELGGKSEERDTRDYKQCILYLKQARNSMFQNGKAFAHLQRDAVVGAVAASFEQDHYSLTTQKLPMLTPQHKSTHSPSLLTVPNHSSSGSQLHNSSTGSQPQHHQAFSQFPYVNGVTRHLIPAALFNDVRLNVYGKSAALKSQDQGGRHGDRSNSVPASSSTDTSLSSFLSPSGSVYPQLPPAPPNTAHGSRGHATTDADTDSDQKDLSGQKRRNASSDLSDPFGCDTWHAVHQQDVRVAGESETRRQRSPGVSFVAPLSSPKTLTTRQSVGAVAEEKKQSYFLVRRLAADLNRKRSVPSSLRGPTKTTLSDHHHISDGDDKNSEDEDDGAGVADSRPSTTEGPYPDMENFLTPVIRVTIKSTFKG